MDRPQSSVEPAFHLLQHPGRCFHERLLPPLPGTGTVCTSLRRDAPEQVDMVQLRLLRSVCCKYSRYDASTNFGLKLLKGLVAANRQASPSQPFEVDPKP